MNLPEINIVSTAQTGPHHLREVFDNGNVQEVDLAPFLSRMR